ncbi:MAG: glycosyltransferase family 4 protein [Bacteroidales bacterium]|nr:glycosyltransferase family 4 protein [Bacteroidales bacterium]
MKIAVNTRLLLPDRLEGIGWFEYETLKIITRQHPEHQFFFIFDRPYSSKFVFSNNIEPVAVFPPARHPYLWYAFFEYAVPRTLKRVGADIFLSPDGWLSLKTDILQIAVIHDLNFEHHDDFLKPSHQKYMKKYFPQFANVAARIATVSEFSKQDIHTLYDIPNDRIDVVYNGVNTQRYVPLSEERKKLVRETYTQGHDYFLFVSAIHKRKNLANILRAFDKFKSERDSEIKFVVVGDKAGMQGDLDEVYRSMKYREDVIFLGHISTMELGWLQGAAIALVYASLFEGFGIPIVEAFHAETAVITSNVTSMPEVAGDAALLVNPYDYEEIAFAMRKLADEPDLRETLIQKGRAQREKFSWKQSADNLWNCVEKVINSL